MAYSKEIPVAFRAWLKVYKGIDTDIFRFADAFRNQFSAATADFILSLSKRLNIDSEDCLVK